MPDDDDTAPKTVGISCSVRACMSFSVVSFADPSVPTIAT